MIFFAASTATPPTKVTRQAEGVYLPVPHHLSIERHCFLTFRLRDELNQRLPVGTTIGAHFERYVDDLRSEGLEKPTYIVLRSTEGQATHSQNLGHLCRNFALNKMSLY